MKQSTMMGKDRVRHSSLNVEGSDYFKKMRAETKAKEEKEKKQLGSSGEVEEEEGGDEDGGGEEEEEEDGGALEAAVNFFEDQGWTAPLEDKGWTAPTLKNNFFEEHDEYEAQEEAEDEPGELPRQLKLERPTIERGESREAKRAYNTDPTNVEEDQNQNSKEERNGTKLSDDKETQMDIEEAHLVIIEPATHWNM